MGDMSEYKGLLTVVTFLGVFVLLLQIVPSQFFVASEGRAVVAPELFEISDIYTYAETESRWLNNSGEDWVLNNQYKYWPLTLGGHQVNLYYLKPNNTYGFYEILMLHIYYEWIIWPADHYMTFYKGGIDIGLELRSNYAGTNEMTGNPCKVTVKCDHTSFDLSVAYNETAYSSFDDAWDHGQVGVFIGVTLDNVNTAYNALDLIGTLLFFAMPAETPLIVKLILSIPIWACVSYLIFIFMLRALGGIFGGGA